MREVIIATKNPGKAREFERLFNQKEVTVRTLLDFPEVSNVEETGSSFEENAILKAETVSKKLRKMVVADDSGLIVDVLGGRPGIFSARYAGAEQNDEANIDKVLQELKDVDEQDRSARFYCALAVAAPNRETFTVNGACEGTILLERTGTNGFGYDPIFFVTEKGKSMAELKPEEKNEISHRAKALNRLKEKLDLLLEKEERQ